MNLDSEAVVLGLDAHHPELLYDGLWIGKTLGKLAAERLANGDLEGVKSLLTFGPERPGDQAQVGGPVVGGFQDRSQ